MLRRRAAAFTYVVATLLFFIIGMRAKEGGLWWGIAVGWLGAFLLVAVQAIAEHSGRVPLFIQTVLFFWKREPVRFSISYLFRIRNNGRYLLIKNDAFDKYQPVGGIYKSLRGAEVVFERLGVQPDTSLPIDAAKQHDLRVRVRRRDALAFISWFESARDREIGPWREFQNELIAPGLVDGAPFEGLMFRWLRRHETGLQWSRHFGCDEIKIADIFEPELTERQAEVLERAVKNSRGTLIFVDGRQIATGRSGQAILKEDLSETTAWVI